MGRFSLDAIDDAARSLLLGPLAYVAFVSTGCCGELRGREGAQLCEGVVQSESASQMSGERVYEPEARFEYAFGECIATAFVEAPGDVWLSSQPSIRS